MTTNPTIHLAEFAESSGLQEKTYLPYHFVQDVATKARSAKKRFIAKITADSNKQT